MWSVKRGKVSFGAVAALLGTLAFTSSALAKDNKCDGLPSHDQLRTALQAAVAAGGGGFGLNMWGTVVNRDGIVCAVAFTGASRGDQWPGSRVISAQKANTANAFSLPALALSTANLYSAVQDGQSLFGLQFSNPVDTKAAYSGNSANNGQSNDPMVGDKIGGVNVFGGGLGLYAAGGTLIGGIGVSGDTSCRDHWIAWETRKGLSLNNTPTNDNIIYDLTVDPITGHTTSASGFGHPACNPTSPTPAS